MSTVQQQSGIRAKTHLGWLDLGRLAAPVTMTQKRYEAQDEASDGTLLVQRPFQGVGFSNFRKKDTLNFKWPDFRESPGLEALGFMAAMSLPIDVVVWKHDYETWTGYGRNVFYFRRRDAISSGITPYPTADPSFPPRLLLFNDSLGGDLSIATEYSVANGNLVYKSTVDMNAGDPGAGVAWIEAGGHRSGRGYVTMIKVGDDVPLLPDILGLAYIPLYYGVIGALGARSFVGGQGPMQPEDRTIVEI